MAEEEAAAAAETAPEAMETTTAATEEAAAEEAPAAKKRKLVDPSYVPPLLAPIAQPLADDRLQKRVFRLVAAATAAKQIRRGVKEVVKAIRKEKAPQEKRRMCVLAGDITPIDVVSHIPILCEENSIPYVFVRSRAVLGQFARTKRPTSVVLITLPRDSEHDSLFARCHKKIEAIRPSFA